MEVQAGPCSQLLRTKKHNMQLYKADKKNAYAYVCPAFAHESPQVCILFPHTGLELFPKTLKFFLWKSNKDAALLLCEISVCVMEHSYLLTTVKPLCMKMNVSPTCPLFLHSDVTFHSFSAVSLFLTDALSVNWQLYTQQPQLWVSVWPRPPLTFTSVRVCQDFTHC